LAYLQTSGVLEPDGERLARLESAVAVLRAAPAPRPEVSRADLDKLSERLDLLEKALAAQSARASAPSPAGAAPSGTVPSLGALTAQIEAISRDAKEALAQARAAGEQAKAAGEQVKSGEALASRLGLIETKIAGLEKRLAAAEQSGSAQPKESATAPSILVMAHTVAADLANGTPYAGELDALSRLGADAKLVEALRPFAEKGAPSLASLSEDFQAELNAARAKVAAAAPTGLWDKITGMLGGLVRVRRVGRDDPGSPAASLEVALSRGDVTAAREAWNGLPVFEKSVTPASGARLKALADAYEAAQRIGTSALEAIRRSGSADNGG
jgi:hypothetical protein